MLLRFRPFCFSRSGIECLCLPVHCTRYAYLYGCIVVACWFGFGFASLFLMLAFFSFHFTSTLVHSSCKLFFGLLLLLLVFVNVLFCLVLLWCVVCRLQLVYWYFFCCFVLILSFRTIFSQSFSVIFFRLFIAINNIIYSKFRKFIWWMRAYTCMCVYVY